MTLIDRYLRAVREQLPRDERDDIIDELSDSLHSRFEDEASARGRPLAEAEEVAILKGYGHPMAVAARYRGDDRAVTFGRRLIGPELYPTYMKVLTVNVVITVIVGAVLAVSGRGTMFGSIYGVLVPLVIQFAIVTAMFIFIDRRYVRDPDGWDPRIVMATGTDIDVTSLDGLAALFIGPRYSRVVPVTTSALEFALLAVALTVWLVVGVPTSLWFMVPGPGWSDVYAAATALFVASVATPLITLVRPTWTRFRVAARAAVDAGVIVVLAASLALGSWVALADPVAATTDQAELVDLINGIVRVSIVVAFIITAVSLALEARRFIHLGNERLAEGARQA